MFVSYNELEQKQWHIQKKIMNKTARKHIRAFIAIYQSKHN